MQSITATFLVLFSLWSYTSSDSSNKRFGFIFADTDTDVIADVQIAVNQTVVELNNDRLLQGIQLEYITLSYSNITQLHVHNVYNDFLVALIIGGFSSFLEHILNKTSLPVISFSYGLNDHPDVLHLLPSDSLIPNSIAGFVQMFNWHQVAIATQYSHHLVKICQQTEALLFEMNITVIKNVTIYSNINNTFEELFDTEAHIFILNCDSSTAVEILCHAYHKGLYYPNYLWIILGGLYKVQWWTDFNSSQCNLYQLQTVLSYSIKATSIIPMFNGQLESSLFAQDAVLTLAMGLNSTLSSNNDINSTVLFKALKSTQFEGMTGFVNFTFQGKRYGSIVLFEQYRINNNSLYALNISLFDNGGFQFYDYINQSTVFPNGIPPDGKPIKIINTVHIGVTIFGCVLFAIGMFLAVLCLLFNVIFRNRKIVKLTSPKLNYVIIVGVAILLTGLILYCLPIRNVLLFKFICTYYGPNLIWVMLLMCAYILTLIRRFFTSTGHDIGFTVALMKTWRVHYIFRSPSPNKRAPKDWQLLLAVFVIVSADVIIAFSLLIPDALFTSPSSLKIDQESSSYHNEQGVLQVFYILNCETSYFYFAWVILTAIFKLVLHIIAIILAFRIHKIEVDVINDYKYTSIIVYSSTVLILLLVVVIFAASSYTNVSGALTDILIFLEVVTFLGLTFFPKMVLLYKDPEGKNIFTIPPSIVTGSQSGRKNSDPLQGDLNNKNDSNGNGNIADISDTNVS